MSGNLIKESTATTGTGAITLGGAVSGFATFASQVVTGQEVQYLIRDGDDAEIGYGVFTAPATLTRGMVLQTIVAGVSANLPALGLNLSGSAQVMIAPVSQASIPSMHQIANANSFIIGHDLPGINVNTPVGAGGRFGEAANSLVAYPVMFHYPIKISAIGCRILTAGVSTNTRAGVWAVQSGASRLLLDSGPITTTATGDILNSVTPMMLPAGLYLLGITSDNIAVKMAHTRADSFNAVLEMSTSAAFDAVGFKVFGVTGALPATIANTSTVWSAESPAVMMI